MPYPNQLGRSFLFIRATCSAGRQRVSRGVVTSTRHPFSKNLFHANAVHFFPGPKSQVFEPTPARPLVDNYDWEAFPNLLSIENVEDGGRALLPLTTIREFHMLRFMNAITDKVDWHIKIFNDKIANKWKAEAIQAGGAPNDTLKGARVEVPYHSGAFDKNLAINSTGKQSPHGGTADELVFSLAPRDESGMTERMATYCIKELRHKARFFRESPNGAIIVFNGDVVKSDYAVPTAIKTALQEAVRPLEDVPEDQKDWHPGSGNKVLDLVHPSLFPLIYGRSMVLTPGSKAIGLNIKDVAKVYEEVTTATAPTWSELPYNEGKVLPVSDKFQWLPSEVDVSGEKVKILSYINNLHPGKHRELYGLIEEVITAALPLWEITLAPLAHLDFRHSQRITFDECEYDPDTIDLPYDQLPQQREGDDSDHQLDWVFDNQRLILPEPGHFDPTNLAKPNPFRLKERFAKLGRTLQVIVKLANIELTPDKPNYEGGPWHVEGKLNERIVATALYYYSSSNITRSSLAFRQISNARDTDDIRYSAWPGVHPWLTDVFGLEADGHSVQIVGSVDTPEGRLLTFPNVLQHQVQPFELEDKTNPGHRKILALFLVDPHIRVTSTASVPCHRLDWWLESQGEEDIQAPLRNGLPSKGLSQTVPDQDFIETNDFLISLAEAKALREELMDERREFVVQSNSVFVEDAPFCLCEH
ncbi:hypothetical protein FA15DRAFT_669004 [Coprinopsis marcescibilis]|uniref:Uncharacterized protein n=1 Tax=Coprinopsis marcescibilis TaxID=230819 RepID=A0A5C3L9M8_COPMA|nr:hypothetical protein FA15DRAFT_669004 [Coprinopsis marcescibilis]